MAGARDQGREGVAVYFLVFEMSSGNALWLAGFPFSCGVGFEEAVESHLCSAISSVLQQALGTDKASPHPSCTCFGWILG